VLAKMEKAMRDGAPTNDNEYGFLLGPLTLADEAQDWANAEKNLREILARSKAPASP
jgi:hypothetical protein